MVAQKREKKLLAEIFCIFECLLTQNRSNQDSQLSWFFQTIRRLIENQKTGDSREFVFPENDFETSSTAIFPKKLPDFGGKETKKDIKFRLDIFSHTLLHMNLV